MARRPAPPEFDRRQQILEAALDVFAEQGFEGATTKEIATRADVTSGLIYFYFQGKEDLFLAAFAHQAQQAFAHLRMPECGDGEARPPEQVIREALGSFVAALDDPRSLSVYHMMMRAIFHGEGRGPRGKTVEDARCYMRDQWQGIGARFRAYLDAEIERGRLRPVNSALATQLIIHSAMFAVMRRAAGDSILATLSRDEIVDSVVDVCLHGMLPADGASAQSPPAARRVRRVSLADRPVTLPRPPEDDAMN